MSNFAVDKLKAEKTFWEVKLDQELAAANECIQNYPKEKEWYKSFIEGSKIARDKINECTCKINSLQLQEVILCGNERN